MMPYALRANVLRTTRHVERVATSGAGHRWLRPHAHSQLDRTHTQFHRTAPPQWQVAWATLCARQSSSNTDLFASFTSAHRDCRPAAWDALTQGHTFGTWLTLPLLRSEDVAAARISTTTLVPGALPSELAEEMSH